MEKFEGDWGVSGGLARIRDVIRSRLRDGGEGSYTAGLARAGMVRMARKVGEEGVETAIAALSEDDASLASEAADLLFHLGVVLEVREVGWEGVMEELERRARKGLGEGKAWGEEK